MLAKTPKEAVAAVDDAFNSGDLKGVLAFYEDGAIIVYQPGHLAKGKAALREVFATLLGVDAVMQSSNKKR
jgi:ketosteroid isomerase-like protein